LRSGLLGGHRLGAMKTGTSRWAVHCPTEKMKSPEIARYRAAASPVSTARPGYTLHLF